jgi:hypothetical protein
MRPAVWLLVGLALAACGSNSSPPPSGRQPAPPDASGGEIVSAPPDGAAPAPADAGPPADATMAADVGIAAHADGAPGIDLAPAPMVNTVVLDGQKLATARQHLGELQGPLALLEARAQAALTAGPWSVMDKTTTPPSGDKHDYISLARYYWPTPGAANGCPYVHKDGQTNPETSTSKYDHASRHAAMDAIHDLALAWYFTGNAAYAMRAGLVARTWFLDPATRMNPNVNFGEGVPCMKDAADTGVLNWTEVIGEALDGLAILDGGAPGWTAADRDGMRTWLTAFLGWLQDSALGKSEESATNNHGTWYDTGLAALMLYLGQTDAARALVMSAEARRIASQIKPDGTQPEELARTNSWGYSNWNAEGFCRLAQTASHLGVDLWSSSGGALVKAVDYLIPGAEKGKSAWLHPQISPFEPSWPISLIHAAADLAGDASARAALPMVPPPMGGDLWPLVPECLPAAIQID